MVPRTENQKENAEKLLREAIERLNTDTSVAHIAKGSQKPETSNCQPSWLRYFPASLLLSFTLIGSTMLNVGPFGGLLALAVAWWLGLAAIAYHPAFAYFEAEKRWIASRNCRRSWFSKFFYLVYWPIYVPKPVYGALLVLAAILWFVIKHESN